MPPDPRLYYPSLRLPHWPLLQPPAAGEEPSPAARRGRRRLGIRAGTQGVGGGGGKGEENARKMFVGLTLRVPVCFVRVPVVRSQVEWSGVEWSGVEWSGVEWSGVEWV